MDKIVNSFLQHLSYGEAGHFEKEAAAYGLVGVLARTYEKARNSLEYRADHLVRRAAIERILKRRIVLDKNPESVSRHLLTELGWAKYLTYAEIKKAEKLDLPGVLTKYLSHMGNSIPQEWIIKVASAEIEEYFNLNTDYKQFTLLAFQVFKQKIELKDENSELLIYFAVDKVYAGSDDEQIAYHILKLGGNEMGEEKMKEAWKLFNIARNHKFLSRVSKYVRREMAPLVLLRDMYFYDPKRFKKSLSTDIEFEKDASEVLDVQLSHLSERIKTASFRSVTYVILTKMLVAFVVEVPLEMLIYGKFTIVPLLINLAFPPSIMWFSAMQVNLPSAGDKENVVKRTRYLINNMGSLSEEEGNWIESPPPKHGVSYWVFSTLYAVIFIGIFLSIFYILGAIKFTLASRFVFVFFLTIIAFFAYRIRQIANVYSWKKPGREESSIGSMFSLPILAIGSRLSRGLSKLNFLTFIFDFILEAPFKIILGFIDNWAQFLSIKKEEEIIE